MLKNPCKVRFHYYSHDCNFDGRCILQEGWPASLEGLKVSLAGLFQHICPSIMQIVNKLSKEVLDAGKSH